MRSLRELLFPTWNHANRFWANWSGLGRQDPRSPAWRHLYVAALFETNDERLAERIAEAKHALVSRARQLFDTQGDHIEEETALDDTLQALHALEKYRLHNGSFPQPNVNPRA
jgi:hypothetical protein